MWNLKGKLKRDHRGIITLLSLITLMNLINNLSHNTSSYWMGHLEMLKVNHF